MRICAGGGRAGAEDRYEQRRPSGCAGLGASPSFRKNLDMMNFAVAIQSRACEKVTQTSASQEQQYSGMFGIAGFTLKYSFQDS
ncbi:hypothetical protein GE061_009336 [Apolygus lucorum]|uniref:Uncharacterized protein n=1 Tax=Apolygus lucorum TaxID=248454 RepID=A0A8S9Y090_APOLU|nr:hypothetical protein GE061_009336 [Apolygus lucorum]